MPFTVRKFNAQVKDPDSGQMIPAGLLSSDSLQAIEAAETAAITEIQQKGAQTKASIPDDYTELSESVGELKESLDAITEESRTSNLLDESALVSLLNATENNGEYTFRASDALTKEYPFTAETGKRYTVSGKAKSNGAQTTIGLRIGFKFTNETNLTYDFANNTNDFTYFSVTSPNDGRVPRSVYFTFMNGSTNMWTIKEMMLNEGISAEEYEPYYNVTAIDTTARQNAENNTENISALENDVLRSGNIIITDTNTYTSFNDLPLNKVVNIPYAVTLSDGPDGYAYIGHDTLDTGKYNATVLTFAVTTDNPAQIVQICYQYRDIYEFTKQAHTATRYGLLNNGSIEWGDWSIISQDSVLHSSNRVVDIDTYSQVTFGDFNDAPANAIYQVDLNTGTTVLNNPSPGHSGLLMTFAFSPISRHALVQNHYAIENGEIQMYTRYSYKNAPDDFRWTAWRKVAYNSGYTAIENKGVLATGTDLNSVIDNSVYLMGTNRHYVNYPFNEDAGFMTTYSVNLISYQIVDKLNGTRKTRYTADGGTTWSAWT